MKKSYIYIITCLIGFCFGHPDVSESNSSYKGKTTSILRLSLDGSGIYNSKKAKSGVSFGFDKILYKQDNVITGIGFENLIGRDLKNNSIQDIKFDSIYFFFRFMYEKKWASYLRLGYNILDKDIDQFNSSGFMWAFGVDYKLSHSWHLESGYHVFSTENIDYSRIVISIARHFKTKND